MGTIVMGPVANAAPRKLRPVTLVWIDAREAILVRRVEGTVHIERITSDVPAHHRATGHVRHDPGVRHGGGGPPQTAGDPHRLEHLARFLRDVVARLPHDEDLHLIGPGTVHEHLARQVAQMDARHRVVRDIRCEATPSMTRRQLVARLRIDLGEPRRRHTVGAYRWSAPPSLQPSGKRISAPCRVTVKPPRPQKVSSDRV